MTRKVNEEAVEDTVDILWKILCSTEKWLNDDFKSTSNGGPNGRRVLERETVILEGRRRAAKDQLRSFVRGIMEVQLQEDS